MRKRSDLQNRLAREISFSPSQVFLSTSEVPITKVDSQVGTLANEKKDYIEIVTKFLGGKLTVVIKKRLFYFLKKFAEMFLLLPERKISNFSLSQWTLKSEKTHRGKLRSTVKGLLLKEKENQSHENNENTSRIRFHSD
ncbi:CLUMA_CG018529, isoform A [Clunio marinus]|uniref:CLUMA_CG018529, isoform A n=1 Tax=Clunio marinus TaxID=568069 RepID=A0A1J1IXX4_9DIPT|nr:CLUMA_CG018529, isoform A [Clunio marinus]